MDTSSGAQRQAHNHRNKSIQGKHVTVASDYPEEMEMDRLHDQEFKIRELQEHAETHLYYAKIYNKQFVWY